ncbi:MAG: VPLPA-CTERM sorting domain-containing protein [Proteobacteria bacterium]|nr:VPLPA-CTERM sorting domain-containing protein [Pseudomonadota bacterium]
MKIHSRIALFSISVSLLFVLSLPIPSFGWVFSSIYPSDSSDSILTFGDGVSTQYSYNTGPVVSNEQYIHTNSIDINHNTGSIKGYSGYSLDTARTVTRTENLINAIAGTNEPAYYANIAGAIFYDSIARGPEEIGNPAYGTVFIDVEGSFNYEFGAPSLAIVGAVGITVIPAGGNYLNSTSYSLSGEYANSEDTSMIPNDSSIYTIEALQVSLPSGEVLYNPTLPEIHTDVQFISQDPDALSLRVSLSVPIQNGDQWMIDGLVGGGATHAYLEDFSEIEIGDTGEVAAASGYVDFQHSATIGIELPEGFTLEGENAPPQSIINYSTSPVPLPGAIWLLCSGLIGIVGFRRKI